LPRGADLCGFDEGHEVACHLTEGKNGERAVSLARFGDYDVRLVELSQTSCAPPLWMELYAHDTGSTIDSCSCHEFEEAAAAAEHLISQAKCLNESSEREGNEMRP
jgi:hypothetical protein